MSAAALQAIKKFRLHELKGLPHHLNKFGPLASTEPSNALQLPNPFIPRRHPQTGKWFEPKYSLRRQAELVKKAKEANMLHLLPPGPKLPQPRIAPQASASTTTSSASLASKPAVPLTSAVSAAAAKKSSPVNPEDLVPTTRTPTPGTAGEIWASPVSWEGEVKSKNVPGSELGLRLYAAKKRMFKGHKWERTREAKEEKQKILMRDMERRVKNYKMYYQRRKPDPLKPARSSKAPKLPF